MGIKSNFHLMINHLEPVFKILKHVYNDNMGKPIIPIAVDFDQTISKSFYPAVGDANEHAIDIMIEWQEKYNVGWILYTMRSDKNGTLAPAVKWLQEQGIKLYGIGYAPNQEQWTSTNKPSSIFSIDDINIGTPMIYEDGRPPRVDWLAIKEILEPILKHISEHGYH
jgi:hypothetical protein